jgi:predicted nucleic acid-binding Zn ribbon protein
MNDPLARKCPQCKKLKLRRLFGTGGAVVFKGSGFYQTDYRSESYKKGAKAESGASGENKPSKSSETPSASPKSEGSSGDKPAKSKSSDQ